MKAILATLVGVLLVSSCGSSKATGSFPDFYSLAKEAVPKTGTSSSTVIESILNVGPARYLSGLASSYTTTSAEFDTAFSTSQNYIGQVLNDAGPTGPVKSMFVLLGQMATTISDINSNYSSASGEAANCNAIPATTTVTTPFFKTATNAVFNSWDDAGKYTCYTLGNSSPLFFGRSAVASPSVGCTDAFEYYIMQGYGSDNATNTESVSTRGATVDTAAVKKFYYHGCTKDFKMAFAHTTLYSAGVEFSSRSEISGNTSAHSFSMRSDYIDADTTYATHITIVGTGVSKLTTASTGSPARFIMGDRKSVV